MHAFSMIYRSNIIRLKCSLNGFFCHSLSLLKVWSCETLIFRASDADSQKNNLLGLKMFPVCVNCKDSINHFRVNRVLDCKNSRWFSENQSRSPYLIRKNTDCFSYFNMRPATCNLQITPSVWNCHSFVCYFSLGIKINSDLNFLSST